MGVTQEQIKNALKSVKYPGFSRDIVSFGLVKDIVSTGAETRVQLVLTTNDPAVPRAIKADAENVLRGLGLPEPKVLIDIHAPPGGVGSSGVGARRNGANSMCSSSICRLAPTIFNLPSSKPLL